MKQRSRTFSPLQAQLFSAQMFTVVFFRPKYLAGKSNSVQAMDLFLWSPAPRRVSASHPHPPVPAGVRRHGPRKEHLPINCGRKDTPLEPAGLVCQRDSRFPLRVDRLESLFRPSGLPDPRAVIPVTQLGLLHTVWLTSHLRVSFPMGIRLDRLSFAITNSA